MLCAIYHVFEESITLLGFFFSSRRRHTRLQGDWSSDVCSSDLVACTCPTCSLAPAMAVAVALWAALGGKSARAPLPFGTLSCWPVLGAGPHAMAIFSRGGFPGGSAMAGGAAGAGGREEGVVGER